MRSMGRCPMTNKSISIVLYLGVRYWVVKYMARWFSWLERRPVTAEVRGSSPLRVASCKIGESDMGS